MTCEDLHRLMDDLLDGDLSPEQAQACEAHLAGCASCRPDVEETRALLAQAADLPRELLPEQDLWPAIESQLAEKEPRVARAPRPAWQLALAAVALVGLGAALATAFLERPPSAPQEQSSTQLVQAPLDWEPGMRQASQQLAQTLDSRRAALDPATVIVIEENLKLIDMAIADCHAALAADPANQQLESALLATWQKKVDLLERASRLPTRS